MSLADSSAGRRDVVEMVGTVVTLRVTDLSDWCGDYLIEVRWQLVQLRKFVAVHGDDEGILRGAGAAVPPVRGTVGRRARLVLRGRLGRQVTVAGGRRRRVGGQVGLLLGAPLQGDRLLHRVRVDELQDADLLGDDFADLPGGEVRHQLGDQTAVTLGLQLAVLHRLLDGGDHRLVPAVLGTLRDNKHDSAGVAGGLRYLWFYFANVCNLKLLTANILGDISNIFTLTGMGGHFAKFFQLVCYNC